MNGRIKFMFCVARLIKVAVWHVAHYSDSSGLFDSASNAAEVCCRFRRF